MEERSWSPRSENVQEKNCLKLGRSHKFISRKEEFETHVIVILVYHSVARPVLLLKKCESFRFERFLWADKGP